MNQTNDVIRLCESLARLTEKLDSYIENNHANSKRIEGVQVNLDARISSLEHYRSRVFGFVGTVSAIAAFVGGIVVFSLERFIK